MKSTARRAVRWASFGVLLFVSAGVQAQDTPDYFRQNCMNCHTIGGGRLTGPDLKDVTQRKDREWLIKFMRDPASTLANKADAYAQKILEASKGVVMPAAPAMTIGRAEKLLDLIEAESALDESQFKGIQISTEPFTLADVSRGREIFLGHETLEAGGTSCISCHSMHDLKALGGGRLGPDLTNVYERLEGRTSMSAWLMEGTGAETMQPVFKKHPLTAEEIHALVAYFESSAAERPSTPSVSRVAFLLMGLAGAAALVFLFDVIWKRRFHAVRRPLVESLPSRGEV